MKSLVVASLCLSLCLSGVQSDRPIAMSDEMRLYNHLIGNYDTVNPDRAVIPLFHTEDTQQVNFGVALVSFLGYDPASEIATFRLWERWAWKDQLLTWNPADFGDIQHIRIPIQKIWKPDIILYNGVGPEPEHRDFLAVVRSNGEVLYIPRTERKVRCPQDGEYDITICVLKYGSWTYDGFRMDLGFYGDLEDVDVNDYVMDNEYELMEHGAQKNVKYYPCCLEPYPDLTFKLEFMKMVRLDLDIVVEPQSGHK